MNKTRKLAALAACATAACLAATAPAQAQTADFSTWTRAGDAAPALQLPSLSAVLSTAATDSGESPVAGGNALQYFELEPALFLDGGLLPADTYEGSGLQHSFTLAEGSIAWIGFSWTLSTQSYDPAFADRAFIVIDGSNLIPLATVEATAVSGSLLASFTTPGAHSFAVAVMDVNDYTGVSVLGLSNLTVTVTAVPEPASLGLLAAGLGVVGFAARRRAQAAAV
jgi:PEP-CTERM motif